MNNSGKTRREILAGAMAVAGASIVMPRTARSEVVTVNTTRFFNVTEFGAVPDGKTDAAKGAQEAINAAVKAGGGCVHFPSGIYRLAQPLTVKSADRIDITGDGRSSVLLHDHRSHLLVWPEEHACRETTVRDLVFEAVREQPIETAVIAMLGGVERSYFGNLLLTASQGGRLGSGVISRKVADTTTFDQCVFWGVAGTGIEVARGSEVRIVGGRIVGYLSPAPVDTSCGVFLAGDNGGVHILTTDIIGLHTALRIGTPTAVSNREVFLTHSTIDSCRHGLVQRDHTYTSIAGCWTASCDEEQILLDKEAAHAIMVITGGTIFNGGAYNRGGTNNGMVVRAGTFVLNGVAIRNNKGTGLLVEGEGSQGYVVSGCRIFENGTGAVLNGNAYTVQNNVFLRNKTQLVDEGGPEKLVNGNLMSDVAGPKDPFGGQRAKR